MKRSYKLDFTSVFIPFIHVDYLFSLLAGSVRKEIKSGNRKKCFDFCLFLINWRDLFVTLSPVRYSKIRSQSYDNYVIKLFEMAMYMCMCVTRRNETKYSRTPLSRTWLSRIPRYLELKPISLGYAPVFPVIYYRLSRTPRYVELFFVSLDPSSSRLSRTLMIKLMDKKQKVSKCS